MQWICKLGDNSGHINSAPHPSRRSPRRRHMSRRSHRHRQHLRWDQFVDERRSVKTMKALLKKAVKDQEAEVENKRPKGKAIL